ncbi:M-phase phosphoprotein 6 [Aethina tumida]|uniref:M-phase phosphoprotein 6 n=1 Tax=Aethina tumida TaxID=116153 RepID=UPI00096B4148|nr:M-phase phosphoprotein 6 [Aethina tumida]
MEDSKQVKLSKGILDMKFMKKTRERVLKEADDAEGKAMYSDEITEEMKRAGNTIFIETSLTLCKDLIDGRMSFGGMNPEIEKLMSNDYLKKLEQSEKKKETEISDVEMAKGYSTAVDLISKKFQKGRPRSKNKKFVKPDENEEY